jgi:hypothetical protein
MLRGPWDAQQEDKNRRTTDMAGGLYVETTADLGAGRNEVPTLQHHHSDLLLYRQIFRPSVQTPQIGQ